MVPSGTAEPEQPLDPEILSTLVAGHRRFLAFLEPRVGSRDAAEEILQAALAKAVEKSGDVQRSDSAVAWFYRVLRNTLIDHRRRRTAHDRALEAVAARAETGDAFDGELRGEVCACFEGLMQTLRPSYATILRAVDLEDRAVVDVAQELGITANNAGVRLHRARQALRRRLEQACSTCAEHGCLDCTCESIGHDRG